MRASPEPSPSNRRVAANAIAPGPTETELFRSNNPPGSEGEARYVAQVPRGRLGRPEEVAAAIAFVASDAASFGRHRDEVHLTAAHRWFGVARRIRDLRCELADDRLETGSAAVSRLA